MKTLSNKKIQNKQTKLIDLIVQIQDESYLDSILNFIESLIHPPKSSKKLNPLDKKQIIQKLKSWNKSKQLTEEEFYSKLDKLK